MLSNNFQVDLDGVSINFYFGVPLSLKRNAEKTFAALFLVVDLLGWYWRVNYLELSFD